MRSAWRSAEAMWRGRSRGAHVLGGAEVEIEGLKTVRADRIADGSERQERPLT